METLEVKYEFPTLELMLSKVKFFENQYIENDLKVKMKMYIGNKEYYSIFVIE